MLKRQESQFNLHIEVPDIVQTSYEEKYMQNPNKPVIVPPLESRYSSEDKTMKRVSNLNRISKYPVQRFEKNPELFANLAHLIYQRERLFNPGKKKDVPDSEQVKSTSIDITSQNGLMRLGAHVKTHALVGEKRHGVSDTLSIPEWDWQGLEAAVTNKILSLNDYERIVVDTINYLRAHLYTGLNQDKLTKSRFIDEIARRQDMLLCGVQTLKDIKSTLLDELQQSLDLLKNFDINPPKLSIDKEIYVQKIRHLLWITNKLHDQESRIFVLEEVKQLMKKFSIQEDDFILDMATHAGMADTEFRTVYNVAGIKQLAHLYAKNPTHAIDEKYCEKYTFEQLAQSLSRETNSQSLLSTTPEMNIGWRV